MPYAATMQFRTSLDQAGRIAGLAGELGVAEAVVLRALLDRSLRMDSAVLLRELHLDLVHQAREEIHHEDALIDAHGG